MRKFWIVFAALVLASAIATVHDQASATPASGGAITTPKATAPVDKIACVRRLVCYGGRCWHTGKCLHWVR
jgi:hypothetical protein